MIQLGAASTPGEPRVRQRARPPASSSEGEASWPASLPMYALPEMTAANAALLAALHRRARAKGVTIPRDRSVAGDSAPLLFTQVCGYPLFKHDRDRYRLLATPHYAFPGCVGSSHRAFFVVRADDPAERLEDLRGRVFGANSLLSNSGMNLPRLSLARIAGGRPFFRSVVITGAHTSSLARLADRSIDACAIDNVTWGLFSKFRPGMAKRYRVIDETVASPSLPFVTSMRTREADAVALVEALYEVMKDPQTTEIRSVLGLSGLSVPDVAAYARLADHEREAEALGFAQIA